jgi:hypothetical protein
MIDDETLSSHQKSLTEIQVFNIFSKKNYPKHVDLGKSKNLPVSEDKWTLQKTLFTFPEGAVVSVVGENKVKNWITEEEKQGVDLMLLALLTFLCLVHMILDLCLRSTEQICLIFENGKEVHLSIFFEFTFDSKSIDEYCECV